jgi:glutamyl/glutaminyl-tRNA synthetase
LPEFSEHNVEAELRKLAEERGVKAGLLINAARAALTGQSVGPSAFAVFAAIGRDRAIERLGKV